MKKIISKEELNKKVKEAIDLLCDTVKVTLGPKGNNIIIDHSNFSPFITNDGVTIAENIESDDVIINTILTLAKEASIKTNDVVGDGTTTTLVLLQSIVNEGLKLILNGVNPLIIKNQLEELALDIQKSILEKSREATKEEIFNLLCIASNDINIGKNICNCLEKVNDPYAIKIREEEILKTSINYLNGYSFDSILASPYFLINKKEIIINNCKILLVNKILYSLEEISIFINEIILKNENLVIVAKDYDELFIQEILTYNLDNKNIYLLKNPFYGNKDLIFLEDLSHLTHSKIIMERSDINLDYLGNVECININKDIINIQFKQNKQIKNYIKCLELDLENDNIEDKEFLSSRINMLTNGVIEILVGAQTSLERREKKMRYDDAICALRSLNNGVVPGGGLLLLEISDKLKNINYGEQILKIALSKPFEQILNNCALNYEIIEQEIKDKNYEILYNVNNLEYENIDETKVIDSANVLITSLKNAISIGSMLLTTTSLVINEQNSNKKIIDYSEL